MQWGIPNVTLINYSGLGDSTEGPYANDNNTLQFIDNFSWIRGKHTFRFGGEFRRDNYNQVGNQFARGQFTFQPNATQNPATKPAATPSPTFCSAICISPKPPWPSPTRSSGATVGRSTSTTPGRSPPKLTLSLGLRYEITPPFYDTLRNAFSVYMPYVDRDAECRGPSPATRKFVRQGPCTGDVYQGITIRWPQIETVLRRRTGRHPRSDRLQRFRAAHRHRLFARLEMGGPFRLRHVLQPGHRQSAVRSGAQHRRPHPRQLRALQNPTLFWNNALANISGGVANITAPYAFANKYERRTPYTMGVPVQCPAADLGR